MTASDAKTCIASQSRLPGLPPMAKYLNPFRHFHCGLDESEELHVCQGYLELHILDSSLLRASFPDEATLYSNGRQATWLDLFLLPRGKSILVSVNILRLLVWRRPGTLSWPQVSKFDLRSCIEKNAISGDPRGVHLPLGPDFIISGHSHGNWGPSGKRTASQRVARGAGCTVEVLDSRYSGAAY